MINDELDLMEALVELDMTSNFKIDASKLIGKNGVYAAAIPNQNDIQRIVNLITSTTNVPFCIDDLKYKAHCTIIYSKNKSVDIRLLQSSSIFEYTNVTATINSISYWEGHDKDGYVVLKLNSPVLKKLNKCFRQIGANHIFDEYSPHITLCGKAGKFSSEIDQWIRLVEPKLVGMEISFTNLIIEDLKH
jgi:2'-5' RNA ligase